MPGSNRDTRILSVAVWFIQGRSLIYFYTILTNILNNFQDKRMLLTPWICSVFLFIIVDLAHVTYMFIEHTVSVHVFLST